jgi:hypothetical protein
MYVYTPVCFHLWTGMYMHANHGHDSDQMECTRVHRLDTRKRTMDAWYQSCHDCISIHIYIHVYIYIYIYIYTHAMTIIYHSQMDIHTCIHACLHIFTVSRCKFFTTRAHLYVRIYNMYTHAMYSRAQHFDSLQALQLAVWAPWQCVARYPVASPERHHN